MKIKQGDIFTSKCTTITNTINCVGVMGKGIALEFKKKYPEMFLDYSNRCKSHLVKPGEPYVFENGLFGEKILNFPTKDHWRNPSQLSYIEKGLDWFCEHYKEYDIDSIAFPALGCGNGGLRWDVVGPIMYQKLSSLPIEIEIYAPYEVKPDKMTIGFLSGLQPKYYM